MIGKLSGRVGYVAEDHALIETASGVGYIVYCAPRTLAALPAPGRLTALYTEMVVREDLMQLFGFTTLVEKEWHRLLTSVQGVGAKVSLAILGALGPEGVSRAIALGDSTAIKRAPGVGPKLALRIANELKDKAPNVMALGAMAAKAATAPVEAVAETSAAAPADDTDLIEAEPEAVSDAALSAAAEADALSALVNLGYPSHEAASAVAQAAQAADEAGETGDAATLIKSALRRLAKN
ncbi:MAG: Holliday junction branch migration protein RuvA [Rhodobacteraceae bacterium]|nr:Holliday junction branch migration protein RuvA [Paracoccaceae bacterium]